MEDPDAEEPQGTRFHGLFTGVNRYDCPDIDFLASAVRDATALHALFADNLGPDCRLVTDEDATTARLRSELQNLQTASSAEDVVVVGFSGHGSSTHEIVTYDSDLDNLPGTALPLEELTALVSAIPARHLLVVLDCCFSGGAGAKVLNVPLRPRGVPQSTDALLDRMAGTGRLILTASTASQPAYEDARLGHGLLTYHLLQALLGPGDVAREGQINLLDLLRYVTQQVKGNASGTVAAKQEPTLRGQWDGEVTWPAFTPGARYRLLYPPRSPEPVTEDVRSLQGHGIPELVLDRWAEHLSGLNQLQQDAVNEAGLLEGRNVLVMSPTSSGKTLIGELAAVRATQNGGRSVFLLPTKALVNEQQEKFERLYGPAGVRTIRATGDFSDQVTALLRGQFDIAVLTYEMFSRLALASPHLLRITSVIVIDEVQTVVDPGRGAELEFLLTLIKSRKTQGIKPSSSRSARSSATWAAWTAGWTRTCCAAPSGPCPSTRGSWNSTAPTATATRTARSTLSSSCRRRGARRGHAPCSSRWRGSSSRQASRSLSSGPSGVRPAVPPCTWPAASTCLRPRTRSMRFQRATRVPPARNFAAACRAALPSTYLTWTAMSAA